MHYDEEQSLKFVLDHVVTPGFHVRSPTLLMPLVLAACVDDRLLTTLCDG